MFSLKDKEIINNMLDKNSIFDPNSGCQLWTAFVNIDGYGRTNHKKKGYGAHRLSYIIYNGNIPNGIYVCHKCDTPSCINPRHLFLGTQKDNMMDAKRKGRLYVPKTHCKHGHEFTEQNTYHYVDTESCVEYKKRACKKCICVRRQKRNKCRIQKNHCKFGHEFTEENTAFGFGSNSGVKYKFRRCKKCKSLTAKKSRDRMKI